MSSDLHYVNVFATVRTVEACGVSLSWERGWLEVHGGAQLSSELAEALRRIAGADLPEEARSGLESRRILRQLVLAQGVAARELLCCPVTALAGLPVPFTAHLKREQRTAAVTSSRQAYAALLEAGVATFLVRELESAALAAELGRARPTNFDAWLAAKQRDPGWRVTHHTSGALDVAGTTEQTRSSWCVGRALDALGADMVSVELYGAVQQEKGAA